MHSQIRIKPIGGLGHQLFIWAFAKKLQHERPESKIVATTGHYDNYPWHKYELDSFSSGVQEVFSHQSKKCLTAPKTFSVLSPLFRSETVLAERSSAPNQDCAGERASVRTARSLRLNLKSFARIRRVNDGSYPRPTPLSKCCDI